MNPPEEGWTAQIPMERNRLLFGSIRVSALASILLAAVLAATLAPAVSVASALTWFVLLSAVSLWRLATVRRWRARQDDPAHAKALHHLHTVGAAAGGAAWGIAAIVLFPPGLVDQVFMGFVFAGVSAGSVTTLGPSRRASIAFLVLTLAPLAVRLLLTDAVVTTLMGVMTALFLVFLSVSGRRIAGMLDDNLRLRLADRSRGETLRAQHQLLERVGRMASVGGWAFDVESGRLDWSTQVYRIYGLEPGEPPPMEVALGPYKAEALATIQANMAAALEEGVGYDLEVPFESYDGRRLWVRALAQPETENGRTVRLTGAFQDVTSRRVAEDALRTNMLALQRLYGIVSDPAAAIDEKIGAVLRLALEITQLDLGIVARIEGDVYTVSWVAGDGEIPEPGTSFELGNTYCVHTLAADGPTSFHHAGESSIRDHPCYLTFGLEAYIGSPILVDGQRYGVLNFSSPDAREHPFTEADHALIRVFAEWVGFELSRERVLSRLAESEERVRLLLESAGDGVCGVDLEGRTTFANPAALATLGYDADDLTGAPLHERVHHSYPDGSAYPFADCPVCSTLQEGTTHRSSEVLWRADGSPVPTDLTSVPIRKDGRIVGAVLTFRDITERKEYERRLTSTLAFQSAILDSANYSIIATDVDGVIHTFSRGAERMLGYTAPEIIGLTPAEFHDVDEVVRRAAELTEELGRGVEPGFEAFVALARETRGADENEWTYVRKDGSRLPVLLSVTALRNESDELLGYLGIAADLTERKRVDRLKSEFVSTVSHELRTPLTSIRGSLGLVASGAAGALPARAQGLVSIAARNSERLILLINDILDIEKIESGKMEFSYRLHLLESLVEQSVEANQAFAESHGVTIEGDVGDGSHHLVIDENRVIQVLTNLISNACKFSPSGETVRVDMSADDGVARIRVADRGPGIADEFRSRIFEKFSQADASDRRAIGGTGLGLSITRALVMEMGGTIGFDSEEGSGTTFWVDFPLATQDADRVDDGAEGARILVCMQDEAAATAMADVLREAGYRPEVVVDPAAVEARVREGATWEASIVDLSLPDDGGVDLVRSLRADPATEERPIVAVSARVDDDRLAIDGHVRLAHFLQKPVDTGALLRMLDTLEARADSNLPRILHVEDDPDLRRTVAELGRDVARFRFASTLAEARKALAEDSFQLVLLDLQLPDGSGWEILPWLQRLARRPPVVVFSATPVGGKEAREVEAALLKSRASEADVLATLARFLQVGATTTDPAASDGEP